VLISGDVSFDGKNIPGLSVVVTDSYGKKDTVVTKDDGTFVLTLQDDKTAKHLVEVYWGGKKLLYRHWVVVFSGIPTMHVNLH
jgi:phosphatidate phosphatase APP1